MKRFFVVQLSWIFLAACNNDGGTSTASGDTTTTEQRNTATTAETTATASTTDTSMSSSMPFMGLMDKMMKDMHNMKMTDDPDHDFAQMMKHHHQGAIEMANVELSRGNNTELKQLAQKISDDSQKDIRELDAFLSSHQPDSKSDFAKKQMDEMMSQSSSMHHSGSIDEQFAMMMAMHHQHGIEMSRDYLKVAKEDATKKVANRVIQTNTDDNKKLKQWQKGSGSGTQKEDSKKEEHSGH